MKVCIIGHTEKNYLPYMNRYINFFKENDVDYDIICWQREEQHTELATNEYNYFEAPKEGVVGKLMAYHRYKKFVINILNKNKYDKVIVLTTVPCVLLRKYLMKHYKNKYLFDFRDYSFERFAPYKKIVDGLIENSQITTISSKGFMDFLDENPKIAMNHNIGFEENMQDCPDLKTKQVLNIGFIGGVRYFDENVALIQKLKNTFRYQLWYIGQPTKNCDIEGYCAEHEITNVSFIGKYENSQKPELYKYVDIINSIYGDDSLEVTTALPNRLYEACLFKKPIISSKATYLGEIIDQYRLGLVVDVEHDNILGIFDEYVDNFNRDEFISGCNRFLDDVKRDEEILFSKLKEFIEE